MIRNPREASRVNATGPRPPWPIVAVIAVALALPLLQLIPEIRAGTLFFDLRPTAFEPLETIIDLFFSFLVVALVSNGLWRGSRFVHVLAILWFLASAALGAYNIVANDYGLVAITSLSQIGFFHGAPPIATGLVSVALLLLPASLQWSSRRPTYQHSVESV